jgi:putative DNA primase/helicase
MHFSNLIGSWITAAFSGALGLGEDLVTLATTHLGKSHYPRTDSGNAELFAELHGANVRFDHKRGRWLIWDEQDKCWRQDNEAQVRVFMKATARQRFQDARVLPDDAEFKWARRSESRSAIDSALELAKSEPPISDSGEGWDADPWLFRAANGVIDLRTQDFRQASRSDRITKFSPVFFDAEAECPRFRQFISEVLGGNQELIGFVQKAIGYSMTGSVREQCLFACYGEGRNGKSTLLEVLLYLLGDYAIDLPFSVLEAKPNGNLPGEGVSLPGARFAKVVEIREGRKLDEARIKSWTGGDTMTVRPLYQNCFSFSPTHKLWLAFNHKPVISDDSPGMWRRIRMIPFLQKFEGTHNDPELLAKLKAEGAGILNWALEGCIQWQREGLQAPEAVENATQEYRAESDVLTPFLDDCCIIEPSGCTTSCDLWESYVNWVQKTGEPRLSRNAFAGHLKGRKFVPDEQGHDKVRVWRGLWLRSQVAGVRAHAGAD